MIGCAVRLEWVPGQPEECPGAAVAHVLYDVADQPVSKVVCFDCLRLSLTPGEGALTKDGDVASPVGWHDVTDACVTTALWFEDRCVTVPL